MFSVAIPMANGPTLPPQAYTRETLSMAFNWLQSQPEAVRKMATSPDVLIGLYTRSLRYGTSQLDADAPVSSQNFISNLKNLAEGLKQFEGPQASRGEGFAVPTAPAVATSGHATTTQATHVTAVQSAPSVQPAAAHTTATPVTHANAVATAMTHLPPVPSAAPASAFQVQMTPSASMAPATSANAASGAQATPSAGAHTLTVNETSLKWLADVREKLNLSSDAEAANLMIAVAYKSLKDLLA
jgi:hypothetical protein